MAVVDQAIHDLEAELDSAGERMQDESPNGMLVRDRVRERLTAVCDALDGDRVRVRDGWLNARGRRTDEDRRMLMIRVSAASNRLRNRGNDKPSYGEVRRLARDLEHYLQRVHDLMYDAVELELGGSE